MGPLGWGGGVAESGKEKNGDRRADETTDVKIEAGREDTGRGEKTRRWREMDRGDRERQRTEPDGADE